MQAQPNDSGLTVTGDKVLVKLFKIPEKSAGGILLTETTKDKEEVASKMGWLVGMGSLAAEEPEMAGIAIGDVVLFPRYEGQEFPIDGQRYWILRARSIMGKATRLPDFMLNAAQSSVEVFGNEEAA